MLLRLFDREGLQSSSRPSSLHHHCRNSKQCCAAAGPDAEGIVVDRARTAPAWTEMPLARFAGRAPYYNVLHPRVQEAMLAVVRELVEHLRKCIASFAGLGIQLSARTDTPSCSGRLGASTDATVAPIRARHSNPSRAGRGDGTLRPTRVLVSQRRRIARNGSTGEPAQLSRFYRARAGRIDRACEKGLASVPRLPRTCWPIPAISDLGHDLQPSASARR